MKILVTGCFGFIGYNFLNFILENNNGEFSILGVDSLNNPYSKLNYKNLAESEYFKFYEEDICNISNFGLSDKDNIDLVINFAAESHVDTSIYNPGLFIKSNVLGVNNLLSFCVENKIKDFIQISTDEVYGSTKDEFYKETMKLNPSSPYSASKASADMLCNSYKTTFGLNIKTIRPANNYGIYQQPEKLIPFSISNLVEKNEIEIYGDGKNIRHWLSVKDTVEAVMFVIEKGKENEIYNIGSGEYFTNNDVAVKLVNYFNFDMDVIKYVKDRPGHDFRYAVNFDKLSNLGWKPKHYFENTLSETIDWYLQNKDWWNKNINEVRKKRDLRFNI
tara:strand:- start:55 stop:1053 length:999 start_codon:yes stop_codon:yes gene_type:complete